MELKERVIVVTGAGQGLGKQFAWIVHPREQGSRWRISILRPWKKSL